MSLAETFKGHWRAVTLLSGVLTYAGGAMTVGLIRQNLPLAWYWIAAAVLALSAGLSLAAAMVRIAANARLNTADPMQRVGVRSILVMISYGSFALGLAVMWLRPDAALLGYALLGLGVLAQLRIERRYQIWALGPIRATDEYQRGRRHVARDQAYTILTFLAVLALILTAKGTISLTPDQLTLCFLAYFFAAVTLPTAFLACSEE